MHKIFLLTIFIFSSLILNGTESKVIRDLELWTGAKYKKKIITSNLSFNTEIELRLRKDITEFKSLIIEPGLNYEVTRFFETDAGLRYVLHQTRNGTREQGLRYYFSISLKHSIIRFKFNYRFKFQSTDDDFIDTKSFQNSVNVLRNKFLINYNIEKCRFTPYLSSELFSHFINDEPISHYNLRITLGSKIDLDKIKNINLFYRLDHELNNSDPFNIFVLGVRFNI